MKLYARLCVLVVMLSVSSIAHAQASSRPSTSATRAIQQAAKSIRSDPSLDRIKSVTRLNADQAQALITESTLVQRFLQAIDGNYSWEECPLLLPQEPAEVSYSSGTRTARKWVNQPPDELRALDQLQCDICRLHRSGILDDSQLQFAQDWLIQIYEDMLKGSWGSAND
jgi:hypothetical protein